VAVPDGDGIRLYTTDQSAHTTLHEVTMALGLPPEKVKIQNALVGGGFGGVLGMFLGVPIFACISSLVNWFTNRSLTKKGVTDDAMFAPAPLASPDEKKD